MKAAVLFCCCAAACAAGWNSDFSDHGGAHDNGLKPTANGGVSWLPTDSVRLTAGGPVHDLPTANVLTNPVTKRAWQKHKNTKTRRLRVRLQLRLFRHWHELFRHQRVLRGHAQLSRRRGLHEHCRRLLVHLQLWILR